jgi:2-C-methyl-D-erythritol 4-phosphate cytidylyltransferase
MYQGQTPQTFKLKELYDLITHLSPDEEKTLTDACKIYALKNKKIGYVLGEVYNFKITTQYDLNVANKIVRGDINL